jgi:serine/threonine-protein kinase HipA
MVDNTRRCIECFSHNSAAGKWTRQHQMLVGGKAWGITAADLIALADAFDS